MQVTWQQTGSVQIGSSPESICTYSGEQGETQDVPQDIGELLCGLGYVQPAEDEAQPKPRRRRT